MQGKKHNQEKLFIQFQLSDYVPADNFYRRLKGIIDFSFLYQSTSAYYGKEGQKSIDPVVFMKLMLVGYLENLNSDRRIVSIARMRMDILYFLDYNLDEELPCHSTLSRTRKLYGQEQFTGLFKQVLTLCIKQGLINGTRQAVDSALIQANASKANMVERRIIADMFAYSKELDANVEEMPVAKASKPDDEPKSKDGKKPPFTNQTHYSPSDPDASLTKKPGKPFDLYYKSQVSVDTESHFITAIQAFPASSADSESLPEMLENIIQNMQENNVRVREILADTGYSSGEALRALINHNLNPYIPNPGNYKSNRDGFIYDPENDWYTCSNGAHLTFRGIRESYKKAAIKKRLYQSDIKDCKTCPFKDTCAGKNGLKQLTDSIDKPLYDYMQQIMESPKAKKMSRLRSATIEPVLGSLINYTGMKRINAKGLAQASKCMTMAAVAYNIKKLLKRETTFIKRNVEVLQKSMLIPFYTIISLTKSHIKALNLNLQF